MRAERGNCNVLRVNPLYCAQKHFLGPIWPVSCTAVHIWKCFGWVRRAVGHCKLISDKVLLDFSLSIMVTGSRPHHD